MKFKTMGASLLACALVTLNSGCSKSESPAPPAAETPKPADAAAPPASAIPAAAENAATQAAQAASTAVTAATNEAQGLIDKAKNLMATKDYAGALSALGQINNASLTSDQQNTVSDLKSQIQKLMAASAAPSAPAGVNNLLGK